MSYRHEIRLSGSGGQGLILMGKVLAEAAAIYEDRNATQSQSYGPEARGGASKSEVIISDGDIDYPKATHLDLLLAFTQEACDKYAPDLKAGGVLVVDAQFVRKLPERGGPLVALPMHEIATRSVGRTLMANIVALGVIVASSSVVSREAVESAIRARVPRGTEELNLQAFRAGIDAVRASQASSASA
ncbi:MAG: 2-oxoacid:acceptor oxidoreductase family protein [Deltaproteobacteria bacterium]|nr:2-oxoacid:acceptor oxidoreductase family protein [Deltaproteobacteria bacterium]